MLNKFVAAIAVWSVTIIGWAAETTVDPTVGWMKSITNEAQVIRVIAITNTTDTFEVRLPDGVDKIDCLLVGGGGGGGGGWGGGGGGGGFVYRRDLSASGSLSVTVGAGGACAQKGGDSTLTGEGLSVIAVGGGAGAQYRVAGGSGGSGGGAGGAGNSTATRSGGAATDGQGCAGGSLSPKTGQCGAGGGGAGEAGQNAGDYAALDTGKGGDGLPCDITGEEIVYAGGGGGGSGGYERKGGVGGGGNGGYSGRGNGNPGVDGLGGGGGGGNSSTSALGGKGGDGIVVISYLESGKARNYWTVSPSITKDIWYVGEEPGVVTDPIAKYGAETMFATIARDGGTPVAWSGTLPEQAGRYVVSWTVPEEDDYEGMTTSLGFAVFTFADLRKIDPSVGWTKTVRIGGTNFIVRAYTNTTAMQSFVVPEKLGAVDYLVVGGGGGGGSRWGGGGGAGGFVYRKAQILRGKISIRVGNGGAGGEGAYSGSGVPGRGSTLVGEDLSVEALGGGYGSVYRQGGGPGGSGGGAGGAGNTAATCSGGAGMGGQGQPGGSLLGEKTQCGAGGGGAGEAGQDAGDYTAMDAGNGGDGLLCDITGEEIMYAGGGAGGTSAGADYERQGGAGGGGDGGYNERHAGTPGVNGLGGGGGGGYGNISDDADGGRGGDGIVIFRFAKPRKVGICILLK